MVKEAGVFAGVKIYTYSHGLRGVFERIWHKAKYKTVFLPEKAINCERFSYRRFMAGQFLLEERDWYKFLSQFMKKCEEE